MDVDGTLTDGKIYMGPDAEVMKAFDVKDGKDVAFVMPLHMESSTVEKEIKSLQIDRIHFRFVAYLFQVFLSVFLYRP